MAGSVVLRGTALHRGGPAEVRLAAVPGPVRLAQRGHAVPLSALSPVRTDHGVTVASSDGRVRVDLVEHLLAAVGGLGVAGGLLIETDGDELPLLDGGAARFTEALAGLGLPRGRALALSVARDAELAHGRSVYRFSPARSVSVEVEIDFPAPIGRGRARWDGDAEVFAADVAPARTFGFMRDLAALRAAGRAAEVDLGSVLVYDDAGPLPACRAPGPDEPARHKLLDLIGDLALHGGPPLGSVAAFAPGHTATHAVVARALALGILEVREAAG